MADEIPEKTPPSFKEYDPPQSLLFPPNVIDLLPENHFARVLSDIVDALDLSEIERTYSPIGRRAYSPRLLTKVWLYAYATGVRSSREVARLLEMNVAFMYLAAMQRPDFRTLANFRSNHREAFSRLFVQVVLICKKAGMVLLDHVSIDGVRMKANASKKKIRSADKLNKEILKIEQEIEKLLSESQALDEKEDEDHGSDDRGDGIPDILGDRTRRLQFLRQRLNELEKSSLNKINLTDPECTIQKVDQKLQPGYNGQAAVDEKEQVILSCDVTTAACDYHQLEPNIDAIKENTGSLPEKVSADGGYHSGPNLKALEDRELNGFIPDPEEAKKAKLPPEKLPFHRSAFTYDPENDRYICPEGKILTRIKDEWRDTNDHTKGKVHVYQCKVCKHCPSFKLCRLNKNAKGRTVRRDNFEEARERHRLKMDLPASQSIYAKRKHIVEPVFGNIKHNLAFRNFLLRGFDKVKGEFALMCTAHNLIKLRQAVAHKGLVWLQMLLCELCTANT